MDSFFQKMTAEPLFLACFLFAIALALILFGKHLLRATIIIIFLAGVYVMYLSYAGEKVPVTGEAIYEKSSKAIENLNSAGRSGVKKYVTGN